jgi:hypothetical protein
MPNQYRVSQVIELGRAHDLLLGNKYIDDFDILTGLNGTRVMDTLEDTEGRATNVTVTIKSDRKEHKDGQQV